MDDLFAIQSLLIARLQEQIPELRLVRGARDLVSVQEQPGTAPSAYVIYDGQEAGIGAGQEQMVEQKWLVVTVVRNVRGALFGGEERQEAGPLLLHTCQTLLGWQPGSEFGALSLIHAPGPTFKQGFGFYPLRFSSRVILRPA